MRKKFDILKDTKPVFNPCTRPNERSWLNARADFHETSNEFGCVDAANSVDHVSRVISPTISSGLCNVYHHSWGMTTRLCLCRSEQQQLRTNFLYSIDVCVCIPWKKETQKNIFNCCSEETSKSVCKLKWSAADGHLTESAAARREKKFLFSIVLKLKLYHVTKINQSLPLFFCEWE